VTLPQEIDMTRILSLILAALLAGCAASPTPQYDLRFGEAVRQAKQRMTLNPNPPSTDSVGGMDGLAVREAQIRYHDSFKSPPPVVNVINIGGAVSTQGGGGQ
jgi:hypothetical protein